ncbi:MAG: PTS sugar transporter subunit IIA [Gemmatimonadota bacterium]|nr:PTS sugar transporter subunit IIA [Gemmatimonadota bacterium]MDP7032800.1 PTS sugar transporter subunit IIA [Gemmatimonadota bacterium]
MTTDGELFAPERVCLKLNAATSEEVLAELASLLGGRDPGIAEIIRDGMAAREVVCSTTIGGGVAFPHARVEGVTAVRAAFVRTAEPVPFGAADGLPVDLFVGVVGRFPPRAQLISTLSRLLWIFRTEASREWFRQETDPARIVQGFSRVTATE